MYVDGSKHFFSYSLHQQCITGESGLSGANRLNLAHKNSMTAIDGQIKFELALKVYSTCNKEWFSVIRVQRRLTVQTDAQCIISFILSCHGDVCSGG